MDTKTQRVGHQWVDTSELAQYIYGTGLIMTPFALLGLWLNTLKLNDIDRGLKQRKRALNTLA